MHPGAANAPRSAEYQASVRLLLQLADLEAQGRSNSEEAEHLRAEIEASWYTMTEEEQELVRTLSTHLYTLHDALPRTALLEFDWHASVARARAEGEWHRLAVLLCYQGDPSTDADNAAARAECWLNLGEPGIAEKFFSRAARLARRANPPRFVLERRADLRSTVGRSPSRLPALAPLRPRPPKPAPGIAA